MSGNSRDHRAGLGLLASSLLLACAQATEYQGPTPSPAGRGGAGSAAGSSGATGSAGAPGSAGGVGGSTAGAAGGSGSAGGGGTGLVSDVFGNGGVPATAGAAAAACEYPNPPGCDFARIDGCCAPLSCERANGSDVFNTYPIESCRALVECVQAHSGCSNAADPLCFQDEDPGAPCLMEGYQASHTDPDGPFVWTRQLVNCVCGY